MIPWLFFAASLLGALATIVALVRVRRPVTLALPLMLMGLVASELAALAFVASIIATIVWIILGALESPPGVAGLIITLGSWIGLILADRRGQRVDEVLEPALAEIGVEIQHHAPPWRARWQPFRPDFGGTDVHRGFAYGDRGVRNELDVFVPPGAQGAPVILQIHGGAWVTGRKDQQGQPLLAHMAARGWIGVSMNYSLGPRYRFPDPIIDVKRVIAWIREHISDHGGDPDTIVVSGGSAGGHLAALAALTADRPEWQPGFEAVDTSVAAAVPVYGAFDLTNSHGDRRGRQMETILGRMVMATALADDPDGWASVSPMGLCRADAPPFLIFGCALDLLVPIEETRLFVETLRAVSESRVGYAELPHAQHAFDIFGSPRTFHVVHAIGDFCDDLVRGGVQRRYDRP